MCSLRPSVVNRISRYARRSDSVDSRPMLLNRLAIVGVLSSAARTPLPGATSARAVSSMASMFIRDPYSVPYPGSEMAAKGWSSSSGPDPLVVREDVTGALRRGTVVHEQVHMVEARAL